MALDAGLIDELGGMFAAIRLCGELAELPAPKIIHLDAAKTNHPVNDFSATLSHIKNLLRL